MEHSPSLNLSGADGDDAEDPLRPLLPPRIVLQPQACSSQCGIHHTVQTMADPTVWRDRTQALATTPLYNGHLFVTSSPRPNKKTKGKEKKSDKRSKGGNVGHKSKNKNIGGHRLQERVTSFTDVPLSQSGSPYKAHCRPLFDNSKDGDCRVCNISETVEMQERQTLPEIIVTSKDDEPQEVIHRDQPPPETKTLPAQRPRPNPLNLNPKTKGEANDDPYWRTHNIGWRLVRRRALFLRRQRLNDSALAVGIFGVILMVMETELSWSVYSKVRPEGKLQVPHKKRITVLDIDLA